MPKVRTKSAIKKRFQVTKTGKVVHKAVGGSKLNGPKSSAVKRRYNKTVSLASVTVANKVKKALGK